MNSNNNLSDEDFIEFCTRIDKKKDISKRSVNKRKPIGKIRAKEEDDAFQNYDHGFQIQDPIISINTLSKETIPYNIDKSKPDYNTKRRTKRIDDSVLLKSKDHNIRARERLAILKEKAKQDYFSDLRDAQDQYENCDSDELDEITINLRNDYDDLNTFLEAEYSTKGGGGRRKSGTFIVDPSPRRFVKKRLSFSDDPTADDIAKTQKQLMTSDLNMSNFANECHSQPHGTAKKKNQIKTGIRGDYDSGLVKRSFGPKIFKTPTGNPSQLKSVAEEDEPTQLPIRKSGQTNRQMGLTKLEKYIPSMFSTPKVPCLLQSTRDATIFNKKLPRRGGRKQELQSIPSTTDSENPQKDIREKRTGIKYKPKFKPITEHNLNMYKKRAQNVYTTKVTNAKRTIPVEQRTSVIDNLKRELDDKLKRIDKLPQLQKELDMKYSKDVRNITEQLHDWSDGRNEELNSLKRNYDLRTSKLVEDFEIDDLEEMPKARPKMQLKIPKHNLDEYRERVNADFKKKSDNAKRNMPISERNTYLCNLQKEFDKKLQRIDKIPELAKNLEIKYYEAVKKTENQFSDDNELLQEQLEFLKEEYNAKMANLDEDSIMPLCIRDTNNIKNQLTTNKTFDCKTLYNRIGPVLDLGELPKPSGNVITQKDQVIANLKRAHKSNKTNKQVLSATSKPQKSQIPPTQSIQETVKIDKHLARKQLMEAARARAKNLRQKLKEAPSEPLVPKLTPAATANALRKEGAEDIFHMMLVEHEAVDMSKPPQDILEVITNSDLPKLEIVGNAFELDDNEIVPVQIPTRDLNQLSQVQEEEIAATLQMKQHLPPADSLAAKLLIDKEPIKIPLNKNPDYDPISVPVYLNSYKYEDLFQVRGTTFPKWFPGFYSCGPQQDAPQIILRESPSEILQAAWLGMKPKRVF